MDLDKWDCRAFESNVPAPRRGAAPTVQIQKPESGYIHERSIRLQPELEGKTEPKQVVFALDGEIVAKVRQAPWTAVWKLQDALLAGELTAGVECADGLWAWSPSVPVWNTKPFMRVALAAQHRYGEQVEKLRRIRNHKLPDEALKEAEAWQIVPEGTDLQCGSGRYRLSANPVDQSGLSQAIPVEVLAMQRGAPRDVTINGLPKGQRFVLRIVGAETKPEELTDDKGPGNDKRYFNVQVNRKTILKSVSWLERTGTPYKASEIFAVVRSDDKGQILLRIKPVLPEQADPLVSVIELIAL